MIRLLKIAPLLMILLTLTGCRRGPITIWGTWQEATVRELITTASAVTYDSTYYLNGSVFTFTVQNTYFSSGSNGTYVVRGNTLTLSDTAYKPPHLIYFQIVTLTDRLLVLQHSDTVSTSPLSTVQWTYTCEPQ